MVGSRAAPDIFGGEAADEREWKIVEYGFNNIFRALQREVESAPSGRFMPKASFWVREKADGPHFLEARCAGGACPEKRDAMERRMIETALLRALPGSHRKDGLFHPRTWVVTDIGRRELQRAERRYPDLWSRVERLLPRGSRPAPPGPEIPAMPGEDE